MRPATDIEGRGAMRSVASLAALAAAMGIPGIAAAQDATQQTPPLDGQTGVAAASGESTGEDGRRIFAPAFFEADRPSTALDMVRRVPGFSIDGGSGARGLGGTGGNVLIDGARPTSKDQSVGSILAGIPAAQVERAFGLALGRSPDAEERAMLVELVVAHGLANACRTILNLNEFSFVD